MAKTSYQIEQEFIQDIASSTGKSLNEWMTTLEKSGTVSRNDALDWLKVNHGFGHVNASLLAGIFMNKGQAVYSDSEGLLADQFVKKEHLRPLYQKLIDTIQDQVAGTTVEIKKTYTSLQSKREYAAIGVKSKEIRLAMDLDGTPDGSNYEKMTGIGCMPRISHMVKIASESQINAQLLKDLKTAFDRLT